MANFKSPAERAKILGNMRRPLVDGDPNEAPAMAYRDVGDAVPNVVLQNPYEEPAAPKAQVPAVFDEPDMVADRVPPGYQRVGLPSRCIPYTFSESSVHVRKFGIDELIGLSDARATNNFTRMLDVLDQCINIPIRDLTAPDQRFLMYWWRLNSYTRSPYHLNWVSRYGNQNTLRVDNTPSAVRVPGEHHVVLERQITELAMTKEQYRYWQEKGICFPTVREAEALQEKMSESTRWAMEHAQYIYVDPKTPNLAKAKIDKFRAGGIEMMEDVQEFAQLITHGVEEVVKFKDGLFKPVEAQEYLRKQTITLRVLATMAQEGNDEDMQLSPDVIMRQMALADEFEAEANEIQAALDKGETPEAREEVVTLNISLTSFFP